MQFTGQKAEQPASTACLLARKCNWLARTCIMSMRNATCVRTQTSKDPTRVALLFISYSMFQTPNLALQTFFQGTYSKRALRPLAKGGFPFSGKCRAIDFSRSLSFEMCSLICIWLLQFKRKWAENVDRAIFSAEWKSALKADFHLAENVARSTFKAPYRRASFPWQVFLTSSLARVYDEQVFLDKFSWRVFLDGFYLLVWTIINWPFFP